MTGTPSMAASSMQRHAEAGLAAAGHADANRMRDEVAGIVENRERQAFAGGVGLPPEIEDAELFKVLHGRSRPLPRARSGTREQPVALASSITRGA